MRTVSRYAVLAAAAWAAGCGGDEPKEQPREAPPAPRQLPPATGQPTTAPAPAMPAGSESTEVIGISPVDFRCETVAPLVELEAVLGQRVEQVSTGFSPPQGAPKPCHYVSTQLDRPGEWSFDIDCRERALADARRLFEANAGAPGARSVAVGREGLDHHGVQLLFIDDDAACYVRVQARDEADRLALGTLVAERLTRRNAPGPVTFVDGSIGEMVMDAPEGGAAGK